ncbi:hypothetical protein [Polyangium mundeleinium]|uniref:Uncharacterized protein n=1 Tax=Polyangium mundeleinium TaxID=2995306 RepID=A0ABT5EY67_9BACT|nr:hypothetical protein [Polyangium mundeleinium]MDC0746779.1 hypothetical protein [Polyangium mundeleinium]
MLHTREGVRSCDQSGDPTADGRAAIEGEIEFAGGLVDPSPDRVRRHDRGAAGLQ